MENTSDKKPLIMAYIGTNDPLRGDSKGSIGLARLVAEIMDGQYVYVDKEMLDKNFPDIEDFSKKLKKHIEINGAPDIAIGSKTYDDIKNITPTSTFIVNGINEYLSRTYHNTMERELVSHHLTTDILQKAGEEFSQEYPQIKGELIGIILGGELWEYSYLDSRLIADMLKAIVNHHNAATLFVCPSRRSGGTYQNIMKQLRREDYRGSIDLSSMFSQAVFQALSFPQKHKTRVIGTSYETIKNGGFNPYLGLLAKADHLVIVGSSHSLVSEALFTGKNIYGYHLNQYPALERQGYISPLKNLSPWKRLPTRAMPPLNVSREVAEGIVRGYQKHLEYLKTPSCSGTMPAMDF